MKQQAKKTSYEAALIELQEIVLAIENEDVGVDRLAEQVQRAAELIALCRQKLRQTEEVVQTTLQDLG